LNQIMDLAEKGIQDLFTAQRQALGKSKFWTREILELLLQLRGGMR
jgi:hypothetical protein